MAVTAPTNPAGRAGGEYVDANGVRTYYEVEGSGDPLVMLHGGLCAIEIFDGLRRELVEHFRVYLPERRGHGRTADVEGPFSLGLFADDTIAFMDAIGLRSAHIFGHSDGASIGLLTALRRPDLVRSLVHCGQQANPSGITPEFGQVLKLDAMPHGMLPPVLRELYEALSPDGADHWDAIVDKEWQLLRVEPDLDLADLADVTPPTLVLLGDADIATVPHAEAMARALPNGDVVVVPNANHGLPVERPEVVAQIVLDFVAGLDRA